MNDVALAPELSDGLDWINAPGPRIATLRGRVVALGFWSAGSAYCHNLLDDLRVLQGRFSDGLTVLGIHTPKFEAERDQRTVIKAVNRLRLRFPVANDPDFVTWQHYGVRAWPSVALIDPQGQLVEIVAGDLRRGELEARITQLLDDAGDRGLRVYGAHDDTVAAQARPEPSMPLRFPSGLALASSHLYVADTGHHRILECNLDGRILRQFGSGNPGFLDGGSSEASFQSPRGLALVRDMLYVADAGNHALRRIRLLDGDVDTLAGNGSAGLPQPSSEARPEDIVLNAPWDVTGSPERLFIAMAGSQQIWEYDLARRSFRAAAGSGRLALADGAGATAAFAQPAGLALVQQTLYITDSAGSALRSLHLGNGTVQTLIGQGPFEFGNEDGSRATARMQYPLGLALDPSAPVLWIADAYNDCVRSLRLGGGDLTRADIPYRLHQPAAVAAGDGVLWIACAGAHEVVRFEPESGSVRRLPVGE
ncbi:redoxin domain-containing protein [Chiayiivirga flava]|uniref:Thioredoxin domain-containing protein n=1 Tax=Chiayiivirga flava TaxID=659595 RepID=A0A7W8D5Q2_9GAMM|nr:redoxin domain-containing protein [Chiayiivirga flava]MBB5208414.1 hypothetical protein [Chiayiivirga flava]